jgi:hypothetical protein
MEFLELRSNSNKVAIWIFQVSKWSFVVALTLVQKSAFAKFMGKNIVLLFSTVS